MRSLWRTVRAILSSGPLRLRNGGKLDFAINAMRNLPLHSNATAPMVQEELGHGVGDHMNKKKSQIHVITRGDAQRPQGRKPAIKKHFLREELEKGHKVFIQAAPGPV